MAIDASGRPHTGAAASLCGRLHRTMSDRPQITPGERFADIDDWDHERVKAPHIWATLGYRRVSWEPGATEVAWDADEAYCFPTGGGPIVQGGLVTALLDAGMGGACWTVLDRDQAFLTADLRVEFLRSAEVGTLSAKGWVVRRTRRVVFCAAELYRGETQIGRASCRERGELAM